jgi:membrane protein YqaA with SNARE-associated domain
MSLLALYGISAIGTLLWIVNPEIAVATCVAGRGLPPLEVAAVAAAGQLTALILLFGFGDRLRRRWRWFDDQCARVRRWAGDRLGRHGTALLATSGLLGVPPVAATVTLASGLRLPAGRVLPFLFFMRLARFTAVALLAAHTHLALFGR